MAQTGGSEAEPERHPCEASLLSWSLRWEDICLGQETVGLCGVRAKWTRIWEGIWPNGEQIQMPMELEGLPNGRDGVHEGLCKSPHKQFLRRSPRALGKGSWAVHLETEQGWGAEWQSWVAGRRQRQINLSLLTYHTLISSEMVEEGVGSTYWKKKKAYIFASLFCFMRTAGIV